MVYPKVLYFNVIFLIILECLLFLALFTWRHKVRSEIQDKVHTFPVMPKYSKEAEYVLHLALLSCYGPGFKPSCLLKKQVV